jgi:glutaredoxin-like protein NrdH
MALEHKDGKNAGNIKVYALSTCPWCKKTKKLLDDMGVEYSFVDVDLLTGDDKNQTIADVKKLNPSMSFPTMTINNKTIIGYQETQIKDALKETAKS